MSRRAPWDEIPEPARTWGKVLLFSAIVVFAWKTAVVGRSTDTYPGPGKDRKARGE